MNDCPFCKFIENGRKLNYENEYLYTVVPREPAMYGHILVVSKKLGYKHVEDITDPTLTTEQLKAMVTAVQKLSRLIKENLTYKGKCVKKVYVLTQCELPHFHFHLKPRYEREESGDKFLYLKELEEERWIVSDTDGDRKNKQGIKKIQQMKMKLNAYEKLIDSNKWARPNRKRIFFIERIRKKLNDLIEKHCSPKPLI